jgi:hypothetical protein
VFPVLFPLDLLFIGTLGGFLVVASTSLGRLLGVSASWTWLLVILPIAYVSADLGEDLLLGRMLTSSESITDQLVSLTRCLTGVKIVACALGILQTVAITIVAVYRGG